MKKQRGCLYWLRLLTVGVLGGLLLAAVGYEIVWVYNQTQPIHKDKGSSPTDWGLLYEDVTLISPDGAELAAWYLPSENQAAVLLLHGYGSSRGSLSKHILALSEAGFGVLVYDLRGHGASGGEFRSLGWQDVIDVPPALAYLESRPDVDADRIGIYGFSVGGQIALISAGELPQISAIFVDDPGLTDVSDMPTPLTFNDRLMQTVFKLDYWVMQLLIDVEKPPSVSEVVPQIAPRPLYIIASSAPDTLTNRLSHDYYDLAGEPKTIWDIPEAEHSGTWNARPEEYFQNLVDFFSQSLLVQP